MKSLIFYLFMCQLPCRIRLFVTPWIVAVQAPLSMEFSRQKYWSGLLFPSPGDLPTPGPKPRFPVLQADSLPSESPGKHDHDYLFRRKKKKTLQLCVVKFCDQELTNTKNSKKKKSLIDCLVLLRMLFSLHFFFFGHIPVIALLY